MRRLRWIGLVLAIAACQDASAPVTDLDAVRIDLRVVPDMVVLGTDAQILVTLRNTSRRTVEVSSCPIYYWVQNDAGDIVAGSSAIGCVAVGLVYLPLRLKPFESKTIPFTLTGAETQLLALGQYRAYGWLNDLQHVSAPASIRIIAAAP